MDKGLEKLQDLKLKLTHLEQESMENHWKREEVIQKVKQLSLLIKDLERKLKSLGVDRKIALNAPSTLERLKRNVMIGSVWDLLVTMVFVIFINLLVWAVMGTLTPGMIIFASVSMFLFSESIFLSEEIKTYKHNKKTLESYNLEFIKKEIEQNKNSLEIFEQRKKDSQKQLVEIQNAQLNLKEQIKLLAKEIREIEKIRSQVISEFLNDNKELNNLLNSAYDNKEKQKVKKDSN